jgi:peroxiredoxin
MNHPLRLTILLASLALLTAGGPGGPRGARADEEKHKTLIGKRAPEIEADSAVNGKPVKLADLKGNVVLLVFWAPWSGPSRNVMPDLQTWYDKSKIKGLKVVAVSPYGSDFKLHYTFDDLTGEVTEADKTLRTTRATDKQLVHDFAAYHKLDFVLLNVSKDEAQRLFETYGIKKRKKKSGAMTRSGTPEFVVIDRKGVVRMIKVGSSPKTREEVHDEIKTLLEERQ